MAYKLWDMSSQRWIRAVTIAAIFLSACRGERTPARQNTVAPPVADSTEEATTDSVSRWNGAVGPLLAVMTDSGSNVVSLVGGPDSTVSTAKPLALDLFGRSGLVATSTLAPGVSDSGSDECASWPIGHIGAVRNRWSIGLEAGRALPIALDSMEAMRSTDSSQFVAEVTRIASGLKVTHDSIFSSVPFVVQRGYHFRTENIEGVIALVQRNIPSEADPRSDYTAFIAERPSGASEPYSIAYQKRSAGREEQTVVMSVLAAVTIVRTHQPTLIVRYELAEGAMIGIIERVRPGVWHATWTSDYAGC